MAKRKRRQTTKPSPEALAAEAKVPRLKAWHVLLGFAVAALALMEIYRQAIGGPFLFDDLYLIFTHPTNKDAPLAFWIHGPRPLLMFSYWVDYQISGDSPYLYHLVNIIFHLGGGAMVFLIIRRLLAWAGVDLWPREPVAAFAAGLFLLHPLQTEAVAYVASRSENLSVMLLYAAFAVFLYRRGDQISWIRAIVVVLLFGMAVATKEHTAVLPALLLLADYYFNPGFSFGGIRRNWRLYAPIVIAGAVSARFVWRTLSQADTAGFSVEGLPWHLYFLTQCKVIWIYLRMFLLPFGQSVDHDYPLVDSVTDPLALAGMAALVLVAGLAWWFRKDYPLASFGYFTFLLLLAPTSSFVPIADAMVERRVYLASLGLLIVVADLVRRLPLSRSALAGTMAVVLVAAGVAANARASIWSSSIALWEDTVDKYPESWRANFQLAYAYYEAQQCSESADRYEIASGLDEPDERLLVDWALALDCAGRLEEAVGKLEQAAELQRSSNTYAQMGMMLARLSRYEDALAALAEAEQINASHMIIYEYRGNIYRATGKPALAAEQYRRALELDPSNEVAIRGLQWAEQALGQGP